MARGNVKPNFTETQYEEIKRMAAVGLPQKMMAAVFDMSEEGFEKRKAKDPKLKDAILKGNAVACGKVLKTAFDMAVSGKHPVMTIFYLKCRLRWSPPKEGLEDETDETTVFEMNYKK